MVETKNKILRSAITIWGKDITSSLDDIAHNIGISRRTLHRHYSGKGDLLNSVFNYIIEEYLVHIKTINSNSSNNIDKLKAFLFFDIKSGKNYMFFCQLRKTKHKEIEEDNTSFKELHTLYLGLFKQLKEEEKIDQSLTLIWIEIFYLTVVESAHKAIESGLDVENCIKMAWSSFWKGIKK